jgi:hypothetical protein
MKRTHINLVIDALLLVCTAAIAGIGLLIKFVLVPGYRRWEIYGRNVSLFFWKLDRHQWGTIHLSAGLVFLGLLALHVILHWSMIVGIYRGLVPNRITRRLAATILVCITVLLLAFPLLIRPEVHDQGMGMGMGGCDARCDVRSECPAGGRPAGPAGEERRQQTTAAENR